MESRYSQHSQYDNNNQYGLIAYQNGTKSTLQWRKLVENLRLYGTRVEYKLSIATPKPSSCPYQVSVLSVITDHPAFVVDTLATLRFT